MKEVTQMYLLADERAVQAFKLSKYSDKFQREMTVAEYVEGKFLYFTAKTFLAEFIGLDWNIPNIERLLSKVRHVNSLELLDNTITATQVVNDQLSQYIDIYVNGDNGSSILVTLSAHNVADDTVGKIHLYDCFNQDITGLDYTYENISLDAPVNILTADEVVQTEILDKIYNK